MSAASRPVPDESPPQQGLTAGGARAAARDGGWASLLLDVGVAALVALACVRCVVPRRALLALGPGAELRTIVLAALACLAARVAVASRSGESAGLAPGRWFAGLRAPALVLAAAFAFVVAWRPPTASPMGADEAAYLRQLASLFLEGRLTEAGLEPGPTLLWGPFYLLAHGVVQALRAAGFDVPANGWSEPYRNAVRLGSATCGLAAAAFTWDVCRRYFAPLLAAACVVAFWLGSPLFYYCWAEPAMAHAPAAALTSLLVWLWLRVREGAGGTWAWAGTGIVSGLLISTQRYDVYFLVLPLFAAVAVLATRAGSLGVGRRGILAAAALALLASLPLLFVALGSPDALLVSPSAVGRVFLSDWRSPHIAEVLFASNGGLFAWTPLALVGVLGLLAFARRQPRVALPLLAALGLGVVLLASNAEWWAGWTFGARRLTEAFPVFALGLCAAADRLPRRSALLAATLVAPLVALNVSLSYKVRHGDIPRGDAVSLAPAGSPALQALHASLGHPFSWPAPWLFAWRHGVRPGQFDTLFGRVPRPAWSVRIGLPEDATVLGRGWSPAAVDPGSGAFRWAVGADSTLLVTMTAPESRVVVLSAAAARRASESSQRVDVRVNGHLVRRLELRPERGNHVLVVPAAFWIEGINEIALAGAWRIDEAEALALSEAPDSSLRLDQFTLWPATSRPVPPD